MSSQKQVSRRVFMEKATTAGAVGAAAPYILSATAVGAAGKLGANDRIQIGLIGAGGMGRGNLNNCSKHDDVVVTGVCDVWKQRRDGVVAQFPNSAKPYHDYRELLQQPDIDAVIIATPPHWHCMQAIDACEAGKDIYFHGLDGTLFANYGKHEVVPEGNRMHNAKPPEKSIPASPGHEREWLDCLRSRKQPSCSVSYHYKIDVAIALANLSMKVGRALHFDPRMEQIVGDNQAARLAIPEYRDPWKLPEKYLRQTEITS